MSSNRRTNPAMIFIVAVGIALVLVVGDKLWAKYQIKRNKKDVLAMIESWKSTYPQKPVQTQDRFGQRLNLFETDVSKHTKKIIIISNGPDKEFRTEDDYCLSELVVVSKHAPTNTVVVEPSKKSETKEEKTILQKIKDRF